MSTQKYIDGEKGWIDSLLNETPIVEGKKVPIEPVIDIDPEIEKEIALIQESKLSEKIKEIKLVKEPESVEISDELGGFFTAIAKAKTDLTEKIEKEEVKIAGLEDLFKDLQSNENGYQFETEILLKNIKKNSLIIDIPIKTIYNNNESNMNYIVDTFKFIKLIFKQFF